MDEQQLVDKFMAGTITADELVRQLTQLNPEPVRNVDLTEPQVPKSLVRAQAAIRRINRR
jgi:hypothetical protein